MNTEKSRLSNKIFAAPSILEILLGLKNKPYSNIYSFCLDRRRSYSGIYNWFKYLEKQNIVVKKDDSYVLTEQGERLAMIAEKLVSVCEEIEKEKVDPSNVSIKTEIKNEY